MDGTQHMHSNGSKLSFDINFSPCSRDTSRLMKSAKHCSSLIQLQIKLLRLCVVRSWGLVNITWRRARWGLKMQRCVVPIVLWCWIVKLNMHVISVGCKVACDIGQECKNSAESTRYRLARTQLLSNKIILVFLALVVLWSTISIKHGGRRCVTSVNIQLEISWCRCLLLCTRFSLWNCQINSLDISGECAYRSYSCKSLVAAELE